MTDKVFVTREWFSDRSKARIVSADSPDAAVSIHAKEAKRLGLVADRPKGTKIVEEPKAHANGTVRRSPAKRDQ